MLFNSLSFLIFFPAVFAVYFLVPAKYRYLWLLAASYFFYMSWNWKYGFLMLASTVTTYLSGIGLEKLSADGVANAVKKKRAVVALSFIINLGILFVFKYLGFFIGNVNSALKLFGSSASLGVPDLILPVGISFYTFQALSYTADVYSGKVAAEKNFFRYALFVSFFPQLVAGPIERSGRLLKQIKELENVKIWEPDRISRGLTVMLWGFFMKMVIADRICVFVNNVFDNAWTYDSTALVLGAVAFGLQIYCDFASYSTIAVGCAQVFGVRLMENFNTPYLASSVNDFWRRWHISLSEWFRDYLYIPLGGNRKGGIRRNLNVLFVMLVSGLWHGAGWNFVLWGGLHGLYSVGENIFRRVHGEIKPKTFAGKAVKIAFTFVLTDFAWIFFRAESIGDAFTYIRRMFTHIDPWAIGDGSIVNYGLDTRELLILGAALALLFAVDLIRYRRGKRIDDVLFKQGEWARRAVVIAILVAIVVFGAYGASFDPQAFIYFQF
ncbi:MAG: MBOAT family protein [Clostridia bacterium]|nr:MBOAT family protein [Clostridia bacterium]